MRYFHCYGYHQRGRFTAEPVLQIKETGKENRCLHRDVCAGLRYNGRNRCRGAFPAAVSSCCREEGRRAEKIVLPIERRFPTGKVVFLRALRFDLSGAHPRVWSKAVGAVCFLPLCRGVFIPPRPFLGPRHRNGEGSAGIRCAAGRPSWHRLSGRPVLCQHAFGRSVAAARAAAGAGGCSGWYSCGARRKVRGKRHALYMRTADSFHGSLFGVSCPFCLR